MTPTLTPPPETVARPSRRGAVRPLQRGRQAPHRARGRWRARLLRAPREQVRATDLVKIAVEVGADPGLRVARHGTPQLIGNADTIEGARSGALRHGRSRAVWAPGSRRRPSPRRSASGIAGMAAVHGSARRDRGVRASGCVAMRSSSCSIVAWALGGPPQSRRSSAWILPCGSAGAVVVGADQAR